MTVGSTTSKIVEVPAGFQTIAEYKNGQLDREYVWGNGPDELVEIDRDSDGDGSLDQRLYPLEDSQGSITALTDASGAAVERYAYEAYGKTSILAPDNSSRSLSLFGNVYGWQGRPWTGDLGFFRSRYFDSSARIWTTPDPLTYSSPAANLYSGFNLDGGINGTDPLGAVFDEGMHKDFQAMRLGVYSSSSAPGQVFWWSDFWDRIASGFTDETAEAIPVAASRRHQNRRHIFVNGILASRSDAIEDGEEVASVFNGEAVTVVYNPTAGMAVDLLQTVLDRLRVESRSTTLLVSQIEGDLALVDRDWWAGKNGSYVVVHAHSQGVAIAANAVAKLRAEDRHRVVLFTYGGAQAGVRTWSDLYCYRPYSNIGDRVPDFAFFGRFRQIEQGGFHLEFGDSDWRRFLPGSGPFYFEHRFSSYLGSVKKARAALDSKEGER